MIGDDQPDQSNGRKLSVTEFRSASLLGAQPAMARGTAKDSWGLLALYATFRWLLSRNGRMLLGVTLVGVLVLWINMNASDALLDSMPPVHQEDSMYPYLADNENASKKLSPDEIQRQKRVAVFSRILQKQMKRQRKGEEKMRCIHPKLDLKHDANQFAYYDLPPLNCTGNGMFFAHKGALVLNSSVIPMPSVLGRCSFYGIERMNDNLFSYTEPKVIETLPFEAKIPQDFVRITCLLKSTMENNQKKYIEDYKEDMNPHAYFEGGVSENTGKAQQSGERKKASDTDGKEKEESNSQPSEGENKVQSRPADSVELLEDYYKDWRFELFNDGYFIPDAEDGDFDQFFVQVHPKPEVFERISKIKVASRQHPPRMNVLMFALDSMSHLCYQRKMPKTYKYLKDVLGAAMLENYNIVGDATTAAIIPMLTGMTEMELPEVRSSKYDSAMVDDYPLVWKRFQENGYATLFAEDEPTISTFNLRFNGFQDPPTDHYMRPFWQAVWESTLRQNSEHFCTGDTAHHRFMLQYLEDFFLQYRNVSKFAFGFHAELTHAENNPAQYIDDELVSFLQRLRQGKFLEDTVLIVFGDHGARYSKVRHTVQGKLEERLPLMSLVFPQSFRQQHPRLYSNLWANTQRLSTPFDIHETLLDIMNLSRANDPVPKGARSISLLREIPTGRTCSDAGIGMHWCTCLHQITVEPSEEFVKPAALELMWYLNAQTSPHRAQCVELHLKQIHSAQIVMPNEQVLKFRKSKDEDQREASFNKEVDPDVVHYQLQVETQPCGALYEATIMADFRNVSHYQYSVTPGISRINLYGSQPACVQDRFPRLRKFCCCQEFLEVQQKGVELGVGDKGSRRGG